ncbi:MAG: ParB/RepB/Spo0J family partition protein, partial [Lentisphaerota bacterium]
STGGFQRIPVNSIKLGSWQLRIGDERLDLASLVESVRARGVLHPVLVRRAGEGFELIAGRRRLEAARAAGLQDVPAMIMEASDLQCAELFLVENLQRNEISFKDRKRFSDDLILEYGLDPEDQKELLKLELRSPGPAQPPEVAPMPMPAKITLPQLETKKAPSKWLVVAGAASLTFLLGLGAALLFTHQTPPAEPVESAVTAAVPEQPRPALSIPGTHPLRTGTSKVLVFDRPLFQYGAVLSTDAADTLLLLAAAIHAMSPDWTVKIIGHTGPDLMPPNNLYSDNAALGLARAQAVFEFLRLQGRVAPARLSATTSGRDNPPYPSDNPNDGSLNKTVTIELVPSNEQHPRAAE